jgi:SPP1 gp7 family putative phage head morphogenesis protein
MLDDAIGALQAALDGAAASFLEEVIQHVRRGLSIEDAALNAAGNMRRQRGLQQAITKAYRDSWVEAGQAVIARLREFEPGFAEQLAVNPPGSPGAAPGYVTPRPLNLPGGWRTWEETHPVGQEPISRQTWEWLAEHEATLQKFTPPEYVTAYLQRRLPPLAGVVERRLLEGARGVAAGIAERGFGVRESITALRSQFPAFTRGRLENIARTEGAVLYETARLARYRADEACGGVRFDAVGDSRTTEICRWHDGKCWKLDDPRLPQPPLHFQCRSTLAPILWFEEPGWESDDPPVEAQPLRGFGRQDYGVLPDNRTLAATSGAQAHVRAMRTGSRGARQVSSRPAAVSAAAVTIPQGSVVTHGLISRGESDRVVRVLQQTARSSGGWAFGPPTVEWTDPRQPFMAMTWGGRAVAGQIPGVPSCPGAWTQIDNSIGIWPSAFSRQNSPSIHGAVRELGLVFSRQCARHEALHASVWGQIPNGVWNLAYQRLGYAPAPGDFPHLFLEIPTEIQARRLGYLREHSRAGRYLLLHIGGGYDSDIEDAIRLAYVAAGRSESATNRLLTQILAAPDATTMYNAWADVLDRAIHALPNSWQAGAARGAGSRTRYIDMVMSGAVITVPGHPAPETLLHYTTEAVCRALSLGPIRIERCLF